ncbi:hypothetical protein OEZ85_003030 [Tetradesmus obliquus]|uniref:DUF1995 domain-containing protein n=1 Tax=Tetradesmus obliquus TaxID=3088 RepID=A0ABY8U239_TETOB|nr:hypothetical protein OEZ85_003030 [Tetradesmus obliquus]
MNTMQLQRCHCPTAAVRVHSKAGNRFAVAATKRQAGSATLLEFPSEYDTAIRQAQLATKAALADGLKLLEVEFPVSGLAASQGDGDGQTEMNECMAYLRKFMNGFADQAQATRVFFPDNVELAIARSGQTSDPSAGRRAMDATFGSDCDFRMGYLTKQSAAWAVLGMNFGNTFQPSDLVKPDDAMFVVAYPSFNPREELSATRQLWDAAAAPADRPLIIFNGELDRLRGGYYPGLFFPELAKLTAEFLPKVEAAYYIHNFKGTRPGVLFRAYPGPWQVLRRSPIDPDATQCVWSSDTRPSLKEVSLEILPNA